MAALAHELRSQARGRATRKERIHLTLAFLGSVPADRLPELAEAGRAVAWRAFPLVLDSIGAFPRGGIVWLGSATPCEALATLAADLAATLAGRGFALEARRFAAHATLLRDARRMVRRTIEPPIVWRVDEFALVQSELTASPPRYLVRERFHATGAG